MIREKTFLKRHTAAGPDEMSSTFFKDSGDFITSELAMLVGSI